MNQVALLLASESCLDLSESPFLQLLFNQLSTARKSLYDADSKEKPGLVSVIHEQLRTIRLIYTESSMNKSLKDTLTQAIFMSLLDLESLHPADLDTLMSFIPEASFHSMMTIGTPCVGNDGKTFCSLGFIKAGDEHKKAHR